MGKTKRKRPRRGSLQYWPRKRAKKEIPRVRTWKYIKEVKPLGFAGYKAGMTHVLYVDARPKSPTKGEEVRVPVTILEVPPLRVLGLRFYSKDAYGLHAAGEVWSDSLSVDLSRRLRLPKKKKEQETLKEFEGKLETLADVHLLVHTQPRLAAFGKKKPEVFELPIGGEDLKAKFEFGKSLLGKEIQLSDVFKPGEYVDVHAVTKGKGYQGVIKRFHVKLKSHKAEKGRRRVGTLGNWDAKTWRVAHPGQMGYHLRTEYNKQILKIGNGKEEPITPKGGFVNYGEVRGNYVLIAGSVPGPKKRLILLTPAVRAKAKYAPQAPEITYINLESQQG